MAKKERLPSVLTPLERKLISERDKNMGIFRKKKPQILYEEYFPPKWEYTPPQPNEFYGKFAYNEWSRPVNDEKLTFVEELLKERHGVRLEVEHQTGGDYLRVFVLGRPDTLKIARTTLHTIEPDSLIRMIEEHFGLGGNEVKPAQWQDNEVKPKNPTSSWADKWAEENGLEEV